MATKKKKKPTWKLYKAADGRCYASQYNRIWDPVSKTNKDVETVEVLAADCEFKAALKMEQVSFWRSSHFYFRDLVTDFQYMVNGAEMGDILLNHTLDKGVIYGRWGWVKKGTVVSIKLLEELEEEEEEENAS